METINCVENTFLCYVGVNPIGTRSVIEKGETIPNSGLSLVGIKSYQFAYLKKIVYFIKIYVGKQDESRFIFYKLFPAISQAVRHLLIVV